MPLDKITLHRIFGLKLRYYRENYGKENEDGGKKGMTPDTLAKKTGLSKSYLNEIEKGKKFPKIEKIGLLAEALGIDRDILIAEKGPPALEPVIDFLQLDLVRLIPEEILEVDYSKFFEFVAQADLGIGAFFTTINRVVKNYKMNKGHFFETLLHSHIKLHRNYFEEIENEASQVKNTKMADHTGPLTSTVLERTLLERYAVKVERSSLAKKEALSGTHSYFSSKKKTLFLNSGLTSGEENYSMAYEIAFQEKQMDRQLFANPPYRKDSFMQLHNHYKAKYFAGALLMDEKTVTNEMREIFEKKEWEPGSLVALTKKYNVSAELLLNRWANLIQERFGINNIFLIKIKSNAGYEKFDMSDTLNFFHLYEPIIYEKNEHFCRRWVSIKTVKSLKREKDSNRMIDGVQISKYWKPGSGSYLCLSIAQKDMLESKGKEGFSFTLGLQINEKLHRHIKFLDEDSLTVRQVYTTCEQCGVVKCGDRAAEEKENTEEEKYQQIETALRELQN